MNQSLLKSFAPEARIKFRDAMEQRARLLGLSPDALPVAAQPSGDMVYVGGVPIPRDWEPMRQKLAERIRKMGWERLIDEAAYTWFNRLSALRYMEVHGFIPQGVRVLSPAAGGSQPEILAKAHTLDFEGFKKAQIVELKLDGNRDEDLYRRLILATCESLHSNLPLLFPEVQEDLEILLPDNLLRAGSLVDWFTKKLPDEEWQEIEVLGWLYQYYISELKDQYMARKTAYKKEEIPAVTQLFTPKWIVEYLVHNSLGRSWILHHPASGLKAKMPYYIEPAQQEPEVEAELKRLFSGSLNPEDIKLLDPAMGSGHILVTAYEVLREIYLEQGYQRQQCARLILEKNLYGLDIDLRASEIACFALIMKAREDDPTILSSGKGLRLNLLSFRDCSPEERADLIQSLNPAKDQRESLQAVLSLFEQGTLFGSLIQIPEGLVGKLGDLALWLEKVATGGDLLASKAAESALVFVRLAGVLGQKYDQVVSNPPYLGSKGMSPALKAYVEQKYKNGKSDLFASFILRGFDWLDSTGFNAMVTMQSWMFLSSYEEMRVDLLDNRTLATMAHLGARAFGQISGEVVQTTAFIFMRKVFSDFIPTFFRLVNGSEEEKMQDLLTQQQKFDYTKQKEFQKIAGRPLAYWVSARVYDSLEKTHMLSNIAEPRKGMCTRDNDFFVRLWYELNIQGISFKCESRAAAKLSKNRWFPYQKAGSFRQWSGGNLNVVDWENDGYRLLNMEQLGWEGGSTNHNLEFIFKPAIVWSKITSTVPSYKYSDIGFLYDDAAGLCSIDNSMSTNVLSFLCSKVGQYFMEIINPTLNIQPGNMASMPILKVLIGDGKPMIKLSQCDWDAFETSWDFKALPWLPKILPDYLNDTKLPIPDHHSLASCWETWRAVGQHWTTEMLRLEEENNCLFIDAYGLQDELTPDVPIEQITLTVNPWYRYKPRKKSNADESGLVVGEADCSAMQPGTGIAVEIPQDGDSQPRNWSGKPGDAGTAAVPQIFIEGEERMRQDGSRELVSYALGCLMGRYSLDAPGLVYAEAGGMGFDPTRYPSYPADDDGIVPVTDFKWFEEDAAVRVEAFVRTVWGAERHDENMVWLATNLGAKGNELPLETLRRYLAGDFYKDHLQTYKKRPMYWKFSSGKEKAFEALVYLHRYNGATLSRMRMQYVVPLTGQIRSQLVERTKQVEEAPSTAERKRLEKKQDELSRKLTELAAFDEALNHFAQQQIELDLDDGVRVNYGKFGGLLVGVKDVCGKGEE